jgi:hypothetical protein
MVFEEVPSDPSVLANPSASGMPAREPYAQVELFSRVGLEKGRAAMTSSESPQQIDAFR